jgi:hypothetical protein
VFAHRGEGLASFAVFTLALAGCALPRRLRALAALAALLCLGRAVNPWLPIPTLSVVAPLVVLLVLLIVGIRVLRARDESAVSATGRLSVGGDSVCRSGNAG